MVENSQLGNDGLDGKLQTLNGILTEIKGGLVDFDQYKENTQQQLQNCENRLQQLSILQDAVTQIQANFTQLSHEKIQDAESYQQAISKINDLEQKLEERLSSNNELTSVVEEIKTNVAEQQENAEQNSIGDLDNRLNTLFSSLSELKIVLNDQQKENIEQLQQTEERTQNNVKEFQAAIEDKFQTVYASIEEKQNQAREEIGANLDQAQQKFDEKLENFQNDLNQVKEGIQQELQNQVSEMKTQLEQLNHTVHNNDVLSRLHERLDGVQQDFDYRVNEAKGISEDAHNRINDLKGSTDDAHNRINNVINGNEATQQQINDIKGQGEDLHNRINTSSAQIDYLQNNLNGVGTQLDELKHKLSEVTSNTDSLKANFEEAQQKQVQTTHDLDHQRVQRESLESLLQEEKAKNETLHQKVNTLEQDLQFIRENLSQGQMETKNEFKTVFEKSDHISLMLDEVVSDLKDYKDTLGEKNNAYDQGLDRLQGNVSELFSEKENLFEIINSNQAEYLDQSMSINKKIDDMKKKSELALQVKSDELNELGKKYDNLNSMKNTIETNVNDIKDTKDAQHLFTNRVENWIRSQEKFKKSSIYATAAVAMVGLFSLIIGVNGPSTEQPQMVENIIEAEPVQAEMSIADADLEIEDNLSSDEFTEVDTVADTELSSEEPVQVEEEVAQVPVEEEVAPQTATVQPAINVEPQVQEKKAIEYIVQKNDNLWGIAKKVYGKGHLSSKIIKDNNLGSADIRPGDVLRISL